MASRKTALVYFLVLLKLVNKKKNLLSLFSHTPTNLRIGGEKSFILVNFIV